MVDDQTTTECAECARLAEACQRIAEVKQKFIAHLESENEILRQRLADIEKLAAMRLKP